MKKLQRISVRLRSKICYAKRRQQWVRVFSMGAGMRSGRVLLYPNNNLPAAIPSHGATKSTPYQLVCGQEAVMPWEIDIGSKRIKF